MRWPFSTKILLAVAAAVFLAILGYKLLFRQSEKPLENLTTYEVERENIGRTLQLSGTIKPFDTWKVASLSGARIKTIAVRDGDLVTKGQLLIGLDKDELTAKLATAKALFLKAQNRVKDVRNWRNSPTYIDVKANLQTNLTEVESKEQQYEQNQKLYQAKAISKMDLDRSKLDLDRARADLDKARAQMVDTENKGGRQAFEEAEAEFTAAKLALREAGENLAHKDILAPATGIPSFAKGAGQGSRGSSGVESTLTINSSVNPGQVLFEVQSHEQLAVDVYVIESDVLKINLGHPCMISVSAIPGAAFPGRVASITTEASEKITTFRVRCQIMQSVLPMMGNKEEEKSVPDSNEKMESNEKDPIQLVKVGMTAQVMIPLEKKSDVLVVPLSSLIKQRGRTGVFLMNRDKPIFTPVKVGMVSQTEAEITEGLEEGQKIVEEVPESLLEGSSRSGDE